MKKIKIISMLIATLFISSAIASISGAEELEGDINAEVKGFLGVVSPGINITNQSVTFLVNVTEPPGDPENNSYKVEDELIIDLKINDTTKREIFLLPRFVYHRIVCARDLSDALALPKSIGGLFERWFPIKVPFGQAPVVNTLGGGQKATNISIKVDYKITNETFHEGENLTMRILVMGMLPWDVNGLSEEGIGRIIGHKIVNLEVSYVEK